MNTLNEWVESTIHGLAVDIRIHIDVLQGSPDNLERAILTSIREYWPSESSQPVIEADVKKNVGNCPQCYKQTGYCPSCGAWDGRTA